MVAPGARRSSGETWWKEPSLLLIPWGKPHTCPSAIWYRHFSHASDERTATLTYFQSFLMVQFLRGRDPDSLSRLVRAVAEGGVGADDAFEAASGLSGKGLEDTWSAFTLAL
jgi:hypothetical protein